MKTYLFDETQRFRRWWIFLFMLLPLSLSVLVARKANEETGEIDWAASLAPGIMTLFIFFIILFVLKLQVRLDDEGIEFRFFPFHWKFHRIPWNDISKQEIRTYKPLAEFGGWGIRFGGKGKRAYNVSGNQGFEVTLKDGKTILFGTRKPDAIAAALKQIGKNA